MTKENESEGLLRSIADYERISCVIWLVLGIIQLCLGILFILFFPMLIAGAWNVILVILRWSRPDRIRRRDSTVPDAYRGIAGLVITGILNILFGLIIGILVVIFDFFIREKILSNAHLFTNKSVSSRVSDETPTFFDNETGKVTPPIFEKEPDDIRHQAEGPHDVAPKPSRFAAMPIDGSDLEGHLRTLAKLRDKGLISKKDYELKKKAILGL